MTHVLFIATKKPPVGVLADALAQFRDKGASTYLAGTFRTASVAEALTLAGLDEVHQLPRNLNKRSATLRRKAKASPPACGCGCSRIVTAGCVGRPAAPR